VRTILELLARIATILGVIIAILVFHYERRKQRAEREKATHITLATQYLDYLKLCLDYVELQVYDYNPNTEAQLNTEQETKQLIIFDMLVQMFESAFFEYKTQSSKFKEGRWTEWSKYMRDWCRRKDFQKAWEKHLGYGYETEFMTHLNQIMDEVKREQKEKET